MSNNRMYLVNKKEDKRILLAKYYPSTGWYVFDLEFVEAMDDLFGDCVDGSMWGETDWEIEYEVQFNGHA